MTKEDASGKLITIDHPPINLNPIVEFSIGFQVPKVGIFFYSILLIFFCYWFCKDKKTTKQMGRKKKVTF